MKKVVSNMKKITQSLIVVSENMDETITLKYGDSSNCTYDKLEIKSILINKSDLLSISKALGEMANSQD